MADYDAEDLGLLAREVVLPHRDAEYVSRLLEKLLSQEVFGALDLVKVSSDLLEQKLENSNKFDIGEIADVGRMRAVVEKNQGQSSGLEASEKSGLSGGRLHDLRSLDTYINIGVSHRRRSRSPWRLGNKGKGRGKSHSSNEHYKRCRTNRHSQKPALWAAVEAKDFAEVERLLESGADPEERHQAWTPLMKAAEEGFVEAMVLLLEANVNREAVNRKGRSALSFAAAPSMNRPHNLDAVRILLEKGADADRRDDSKQTAKERAEVERREDVVSLIAQFGH